MNHQHRFRYILRYLIDPVFHAQDRIDELVEFCKTSHIEEVMLFTTAEELSAGHPTQNELKSYVAMGKQLRQRLNECGVDLSLNPWTTTYHVSRGRTMRDDQNFTPMVGETGMQSPITACPLCPNWQQWLCDAFAYLVGELQPVALWVEDDWRLHNHGAAMNWGGCFCELHLKRFSEMVNQHVTREEVLKHVLAPGAPHTWRRQWLVLSRDSLLEPARKLQDVIRQAHSETRLGLMSSSPDVHSAEGRDWHALQDALGRQPSFLTRPHLPPYTEIRALSTTPSVTRQTIANLARPIEIYPELENSPRCGPYSKSAAYCIWQCFHAAAYGSHGITINHYDMMGNGIALDPTFGKSLAFHKAKLSALVALEIDDQKASGMQVLFGPQSSTYFHCTDPSSFSGLVNSSIVWSDVAYILGIAHSLSSAIPSQRSEPIATSDQTLRSFSDDDIRHLLEGPAILDATSVEILMQRGFGDSLGLHDVSWRPLSESAFAYESILEDDPAVYGLARPRMSAQRCATRLLDMQVNDDAEIRTQIHRADHKTLMPGLIVHHNDQGGRIAMLTYPFDVRAQVFMGYFNVFRRKLMQNLIFELAPQANLAMCGTHPMHIYRASTSQGILLAMFNPLHDSAEQPGLRIPAGQMDFQQLRQLHPDGSWHPLKVNCRHHGGCEHLTIPVTLAPLETCFLLC